MPRVRPASKAPKGRSIPAQGTALGSRQPTNPSPEGPGEIWQSVDSDEGVPLAVANRVFGKDALKPIIEELNEVLVA